MIIILVTGVDSMLSDVVHQEHTYYPEQIIKGGRFANMFTELPDGRRSVDFAKFNEMDLTQVDTLAARDEENFVEKSFA